MFATVLHLKLHVWYVVQSSSCVFVLHSALQIWILNFQTLLNHFKLFPPCYNVNMHTIFESGFLSIELMLWVVNKHWLQVKPIYFSSNNIHSILDSKTISIIGYITSAWHKLLFPLWCLLIKNQVWKDKICFDCISVTKVCFILKRKCHWTASKERHKDIFINSYTYPSQLLVCLILWNAL